MSADTLPSIRTKIVATIGPASRAPVVMRQLIETGVNVFRLNFSHGTHEEHSAVLAEIRTLSREMGRHVGVVQTSVSLRGVHASEGQVNQRIEAEYWKEER